MEHVPYDLNLSWASFTTPTSLLFRSDHRHERLLQEPSVFWRLAGQKPAAVHWNRIYDIIIAVPDTRQMLLRRMRTLMDHYSNRRARLLASQDLIGQQITTITNLIWDDAQLDSQQ